MSVNQTQQLCKQAGNAYQINIYVETGILTVASLTCLSMTLEMYIKY